MLLIMKIDGTSLRSSLDVANVLIQNGADVSAVDKEKLTAPLRSII